VPEQLPSTVAEPQPSVEETQSVVSQLLARVSAPPPEPAPLPSSEEEEAQTLLPIFPKGGRSASSVPTLMQIFPKGASFAGPPVVRTAVDDGSPCDFVGPAADNGESVQTPRMGKALGAVLVVEDPALAEATQQECTVVLDDDEEELDVGEICRPRPAALAGGA